MEHHEAGTFEPILDRERRAWRSKALGALGVALVVVASLWFGGAFQLERYENGVANFYKNVVKESLPPEFQLTREPIDQWQEGERSFGSAVDKTVPWLFPLWDTLMMSIAGTSVAVVLSFVIGFLAARNTSPHKLVYWLSRGVLNFARAIPELIMGILFLIMLGVGILPGIFALGFHSVGMVGKFFAEAIEHVDEEPIEAARATGASRLQVLWHGVLPQVWPQMIDVSLYRWEYNFRASLVMGLVGCGGIGLMIMSSLSLMEYRETLGLLLLVLVCVTAVDSTGAYLRRRFA
ncbi:MAG: phosphonate ABC transporter, permease protein PhnE [Thermoanaerobaculia bacterium]|nr:phosphonate ABC transporter, permease protein PhnE [Thermoanaerobaculia bacterium]